jgi:hypothetical protein
MKCKGPVRFCELGVFKNKALAEKWGQKNEDSEVRSKRGGWVYDWRRRITKIALRLPSQRWPQCRRHHGGLAPIRHLSRTWPRAMQFRIPGLAPLKLGKSMVTPRIYDAITLQLGFKSFALEGVSESAPIVERLLPVLS